MLGIDQAAGGDHRRNISRDDQRRFAAMPAYGQPVIGGYQARGDNNRCQHHADPPASGPPAATRRSRPIAQEINSFSFADICSGEVSWVKLATNRPLGSMT